MRKKCTGTSRKRFRHAPSLEEATTIFRKNIFTGTVATNVLLKSSCFVHIMLVFQHGTVRYGTVPYCSQICVYVNVRTNVVHLLLCLVIFELPITYYINEGSGNQYKIDLFCHHNNIPSNYNTIISLLDIFPLETENLIKDHWFFSH